MHRRDLCKAALGATHLLATGAITAASLSASPGAWSAGTPSPGSTAPWTLGYQSLDADVAPMPLSMRGRIPSELTGAFYRNGPARHDLGGRRDQHWFDGDGMLQRYTLSPDGVVHQGRFVRTAKFDADSAAGRRVRVAFGTDVPDAEPVDGPDGVNTANTSLMAHRGELLALWEGGSATRVDPVTLKTRGLKTWRGDYAGMPFSAHPKVESDGTVWNFGVSSAAGLLSVYCIAPDGSLRRADTLAVPDIAMVHDFAVTARHLVFLLPPMVFDRERSEAGANFLDSHMWRPGLGLRVLVLPKDAPGRPRWFTLPAGFVFHIGNAWEDTRGEAIHLDFVRADDASGVKVALRDVMRGEWVRRVPAFINQATLELRHGRATLAALPWDAEFPRIDPRRVGLRHRLLFAAARLAAGERPGFDAVMRLDTETGAADHYRYGAHVMVEEHVFVPPPRGGGHEGVGWLLGTALDLRQRAMLFSVFDAQHIADGPIVQGTLPRPMPLGLHAMHVPA